jgi:hypothetical protein
MGRIELKTANLVRFDGGLGGLLRRIGGNAGVVDPATHVDELPNEQPGLSEGDYQEPQSICRYGVCRRRLPPGFGFAMVGACFGGGLLASSLVWLSIVTRTVESAAANATPIRTAPKIDPTK